MRFDRWRNRETGTPVAHVSVTFSVDRADLILSVARRLASPGSYPDVPERWTRETIAGVVRGDLAATGNVGRDETWSDELDRYADGYDGRVLAIASEAEALVDRLYPEARTAVRA